MRTVNLYFLRHTFWMLSLVACDSFQEEIIDPDKKVTFSPKEYYVLPGTSTIIDLKSVIEQSYNNVTIAENPQRGTLTQIAPFLLKYTPADNFVDGTDRFTFSVSVQGGSTYDLKATIFMRYFTDSFPCGLYGFEDHVRLNNSGVTIISPLKNDRVCGLDGPLNVSLQIEPKYGHAVVAGDSIIYTPDPAFPWTDELVYRMSIGDEHVAYGLVSIGKLETLTLPGWFNQIFFVNENVGFIAGGNEMFKTVDGGKRWNAVDFPGRGQNDLLEIDDIFFLDEQTGFVAFWKDESWGGSKYHLGAWMMTTDGGASWKKTMFDHAVKSLFFTSPSTGYMSTIKHAQGATYQTLLKTVDAGESWEEVAVYQGEQNDLKIRFVNDQVGYAVDAYKIIATTDGGKTWKESARSRYVGSFGVMQDVMFASFGVSFQNFTSPSTIVRSDDGLTWDSIVDLPNPITEIGFSPSGDFGIAIGISEYDMCFYDWQENVISISLDKGITWKNLPGKLTTEVIGGMAVPSSNDAYILCGSKILKYTR